MLHANCYAQSWNFTHMWQSRIEIEHYSVAYFDCNTWCVTSSISLYKTHLDDLIVIHIPNSHSPTVKTVSSSVTDMKITFAGSPEQSSLSLTNLLKLLITQMYDRSFYMQYMVCDVKHTHKIQTLYVHFGGILMAGRSW